ncbi:MAG: hypothetical protein CBC53_005845 [Alphaproteobacteria bacterium TMED93]|nr:MAG: hypothetical protein CBC53_005845 [Alphaproteobacteria bacterium TMED93]
MLSDNENFDYLVKGPLAGSIYYTKKKPGRWKNLLTSHIPIMQIKSNFLEITTPHEMRGFEHFIHKHIVLDKSFNIISEKIFDPSKDRAYSKHDISGYSNSLFVMSICNLHDTWLEPVKIS